MRRKDREMDESFALSVVDSCPYGLLSMTLADGTPYAVPLSIVREGNSVYFHSARLGLKNDCLTARPQVCLTCVGHVKPVPAEFTTEYESAIVFGDVSPVEDEAERLKAIELICRRYAAENMANMPAAYEKSKAATALWRIDIRSITGKRKKYDAQGKEMTHGRME